MKLFIGHNSITLFDINRVIPIVISLIILSQNRSSLTWYSTFYVTSVLVLLLYFLLYKNKKSIYFPNSLSAFGLYLSIISFVVLNFQTSSVITLIAFVSTFLLNNQIKKESVDILTTILSFIIGLSLIFWLLHFNDILILPLYRQLDLSIIGNPGYLDDYLFFVHSDGLLFPRFYSIFEEPGALGVLLSLVILANKYNFRDKRIIVLLLGLIFTYSLAGYITFICGLALYKISSLKTLVKSIFIVGVVVTIFYFLFRDVEVLDWLIFDRISNFGDRGLEQRNSDELNKFYSTYITSLASITGMGEGYSGAHFTGSSYKFFFIDYGWLGVVALLLLYVSIAKRYGRSAIAVLAIYVLAFLPQYRAFISWQILLFALSCNFVIIQPSMNET